MNSLNRLFVLSLGGQDPAETEESKGLGLRLACERGEHRSAFLELSGAEQRVGQPDACRQVIRAKFQCFAKLCDGVLPDERVDPERTRPDSAIQKMWVPEIALAVHLMGRLPLFPRLQYAAQGTDSIRIFRMGASLRVRTCEVLTDLRCICFERQLEVLCC